MKVTPKNQAFFKLYPSSLNLSEFSLLGKLYSVKTNPIKASTKQISKLVGFGTTKTEETLSSLRNKGYISKEGLRLLKSVPDDVAQFFTLAPSKLNWYELAILGKLFSVINSKADIIKVQDEQLTKIVDFGRDNTQNAINSLAKKNIIVNDQERKPDGTFDINKIKIIGDIIE